MSTVEHRPTTDLAALQRLVELDPQPDSRNPTCATTGVGPGPIMTDPAVDARPVG